MIFVKHAYLLCTMFVCLSFFTTIPAKAQTKTPCITSDSLLRVCNSLKGITYKWGGETTKGFDCSGFIMYVFNRFNISLDHSAKNLATLGRKISLAEAKIGDIIIFRGTHKKDKSPGHAGIIISQEGEALEFMHSSSSKKNKGVTTTYFENSNYPARFLEIRRVAEVL